MTDDMSPGPLAGVRVVDLGACVAGPAVAAILADWGADVVKVEPVHGDPFRFAAAVGPGGINPAFELDNRGKRSIAVDATTPEGREVIDRLLGVADAFVTNLRLSTLDAWSLHPGDLVGRFPRLVVATLTGLGDDGPDCDRPSYDIGGFWARSGLAAAHTVNGEPALLRGAVGDHFAAMALAGGICAALLEQRTTGRGQHVATSLLRNGWYGLGQDVNFRARLGGWFSYGRREAPNPLFNSYPTGDGRWLWLLGLQPDRHWSVIAVALGHPEWLEDPRFADHAAQRARNVELREVIEQTFITRSLAEWAVVLDELGVWWEPVMTLDEVFSSTRNSSPPVGLSRSGLRAAKTSSTQWRRRSTSMAGHVRTIFRHPRWVSTPIDCSQSPATRLTRSPSYDGSVSSREYPASPPAAMPRLRHS
jgi:crotonobetainyl-CoA:carnitine CoA-transferase CaiB-like acyl-CoA transferase